MSTILVTGATGTLGREVTRHLLHRRHTVRAFVRDDGSSLPRGARAFSGDIRTGAGLSNATAGVNSIIHCATSFEVDNATDLEGARNLIEVAHQMGSPHLIFISIVGIDGSGFSYFQGKCQVEAMIEQSGLPFTIQRTTQFHGFVLNLISSFEDPETAEIVVPADVRFQSIDGQEVAEALARFAEEQPVGRVLDMAGPEILALEEMTQKYIGILKPDAVLRTETVRSQTDFYDGFRAGQNLAPDRAVGRKSWENFLWAKAKESHHAEPTK